MRVRGATLTVVRTFEPASGAADRLRAAAPALEVRGARVTVGINVAIVTAPLRFLDRLREGLVERAVREALDGAGLGPP